MFFKTVFILKTLGTLFLEQPVKPLQASNILFSMFCFTLERYIALCTTFDVSSQLPFSICYQPTSFLLSITLHFVSRFLSWHLKYPPHASPANYTELLFPISHVQASKTAFFCIFRNLQTVLFLRKIARINRSNNSYMKGSSNYTVSVISDKLVNYRQWSHNLNSVFCAAFCYGLNLVFPSPILLVYSRNNLIP